LFQLLSPSLLSHFFHHLTLPTASIYKLETFQHRNSYGDKKLQWGQEEWETEAEIKD